MTQEKIFIRLIDGSTAYVPVDATKMADNEYKILDDKEFIDTDFLELHQFFPGDTVACEEETFHDGSKGLVANKLIAVGQWPDRKFFEFKYKATVGQIPIEKSIAYNYKQEIDRVLKFKDSGQFIYPSLLDTADKLKSVT